MQAPTPKTMYEIGISNFNGIDLRNAPSKCASTRSPMCVNMMRETAGNNRKRRGYETLYKLDGEINGFHTLKLPAETKTVVHAGTKLYLHGDTQTLLYSGAKDHKSTSVQVNSKLYIFTGAELLVYDGTTIKTIEEVAHIPTTTIAKTYLGGGTSMEPINLITPWRTERFTGDDTHLTFQLGYGDINTDTVTIKSLNSSGAFDTLTEGTDFTVNRTLGTFTLTAAKKTPVDGMDNLYVTYSKTHAGYADRIKNCDICILYGINGARDRIFASGNDTYRNYDWYTDADDPTMWGDAFYCVTGQDDSAIVGYAIVNDYLVVMKNSPKLNDTNAVMRTGGYDSTLDRIIFRSTGSYSAAGALGKHTFLTVDNEPMYLTTEKDISAITSNDIIGNKVSQERSYYISTELAKEAGIEEAYVAYYDGFYMLAINDRIYLLDSTQSSYEQNAPYSTRQYEAYLWTGIGARVLATIDNRLFFGTSDGSVKRFFNSDVGGFTDDGITTANTIEIDGKPVTTTESYPCYWDTYEIYGTKAELKKTFKRLAVCLNAYAHTGCRVWARIDGIWQVIFDYNNSADYFDFSDLDFSQLSFRTDNTPTLIGGKFKAKKVLHIQFRFENSKPQPFSVLWAIAKYTYGNDYVK